MLSSINNDVRAAPEDIPENKGIRLNKIHEWFQDAVDKSREWRKEAKEDYDFVAGKQWTKEDKELLEKFGRPAITINKIKPLMNVLSGYQRLNRYDISFLPRTNDDMELCKVREGITKYIFDQCDYEYHESQVFNDGAIGGLGWFWVYYKFDEGIGDGEVKIARESPFNMYVDPEAKEIDFSDANYIIRAKWVNKTDLIKVYPEKAEEIQSQQQEYDSEEPLDVQHNHLYYKKDLQKLRLVECWYKTKVKEKIFIMPGGQKLTEEEMQNISNEQLLQMYLVGQEPKEQTITVDKVRVCSFFGDILLEDIESPYEHGEIPFIPFTVFNFGEGDIPAGIVRDLKDPQREINKRRSQSLHILNTSSYNNWIREVDAQSDAQKSAMRKLASMPGGVIDVQPGVLSRGAMQRLEAPQPPLSLFQAGQEAAADLPAISGINEALMGVDMPANASGRAIELKQKQAITHIAPMFDNLRRCKKRLASLLWGHNGHKGLIQQFYTEEKVFRIEGIGGKPDFITVNQQVTQMGPFGQAVTTTLNDITQGDFDIIVADTQASASQRQAQMYSLIDAVKTLGVPGDAIFDLILDLSDIPNKEDIKQRLQQRQQAQQKAQEAQAAAEQAKQIRMSNSIAFKDAPPAIQLAMAAKAGLIDQKIADEAIKQFVAYNYPQLLRQQQQAQQNQVGNQQIINQIMQAISQGIPTNQILEQLINNGIPAQTAQALLQQVKQQSNINQQINAENVSNPNQQNNNNITAAALNSLMAGNVPAM